MRLLSAGVPSVSCIPVLAAACASTYALILCCVASAVALSLPRLSSSSMLLIVAPLIVKLPSIVVFALISTVPVPFASSVRLALLAVLSILLPAIVI